MITPEVLEAYRAPIARLTVAAAAAWVRHEQAEHLRRVAELPAITGELRELRLELAARREAELARHLAAEQQKAALL